MGSWSSNYFLGNYQGRKIHLMKYEDLLKIQKKFYKILEYINSIIPLNIDQNKN